MPFLYEFKLNREKLENVEVGFTTSILWEEALDNGKLILPFRTSEIPKSMLGLLQIEIIEIDNYTSRNVVGVKTFDLLVISDKVSSKSKYGYYTHELSVIEYTGKMDYYHLPSLAKTRSIISNIKAPFTHDHFINGNFTNDNTYQITVRLPQFNDIMKIYYANQGVTFDQVDQAFIKLNSSAPDYRLGDVWISTNAPLISGTSPHNLTNGSATWAFPRGRWELYYGWVSQAGDSAYAGEPADYGFHALYTFYIEVIDQNEMSMYDILEEIRSCVSRFGGVEDTIYYDSSRIFEISNEDKAFLKTIQSPQVYLSNITTRQAMMFVLSYINGLPRLEYGEQVDRLKIEKYNMSMGVFQLNDLTTLNGVQNTNQIGTRSYTQASQALPSDLETPTVFAPSKSGYVQVRSSTQQLTDSDFGIKLPERKSIYMPTALYTLVQNLEVTCIATSEVFDFGDVDMPLIERFINNEEWLLKTITSNFPTIDSMGVFEQNIGLRPNRISNLSWRPGDTFINLSSVYGVVFQDTLIRNVVQEAIREYVMLRIPISYTAGTMYTQYSISYDIPAIGGYKDWRFRFEYISDENLLTKQDKEDITQINFFSEMRQNQEETFVNLVRQTRKSYGNLQRTGNAEYSFTKLHTTLAEAYKIGEIDVNNYTITEIHSQWFNDFYINAYGITKHHNRIQQATFINQAYRPFDNYSKTVLDRHENYGDYVIITPPDEVEVASFPNKIYHNYTLKVATALLMFDNFVSHDTKATTVMIRTDGMLEEYDDEYGARKIISTPLSSYGIKGGLAFTFGFANNQIASDGIVERGTGKFYNNPIRYTNSRGKFSRFSFWILRDRDFVTDYETYPLLTVSEVDEELSGGMFDETYQYFGCGDIEDYYGSSAPLVVNKDTMTNYGQTYQLNFISYYNNLYIFGLSFFTYNFLVSENEAYKKAYIYIYKNGEYYNTFDDLKIKSGYASQIEITPYNVNFNVSALKYRFWGNILSAIQEEDTTSWAIGNADGDLYIACNEALNGFNEVPTHVRPNIWEIGLKSFSVSFYTLDSDVSHIINLGLGIKDGIPFGINGGISNELTFGYGIGQGVGISLDSGINMGLTLGLEKGKSLTYDLGSTIALGMSMEFWRTKDIGISLDTALQMSLNLDYRIGDASVYDLGIFNVGHGIELEYWRTQDIGYSLPNSIAHSLSFGFQKGIEYTAITLGLSHAMSIGYYRSKDIGIGLSNTVALSMTFNYTRSLDLGISLNITANTTLNFGYSVFNSLVIPPSIELYAKTTGSLSIRFYNYMSVQVTIQYSIDEPLYGESIVVAANSYSSVVVFDELDTRVGYDFFARTLYQGELSDMIEETFYTD